MTVTIIEADREPKPEKKKKFSADEFRAQSYREWYELWSKCNHPDQSICCVYCGPKPKWI